MRELVSLAAPGRESFCSLSTEGRIVHIFLGPRASELRLHLGDQGTVRTGLLVPFIGWILRPRDRSGPERVEEDSKEVAASKAGSW